MSWGWRPLLPFHSRGFRFLGHFLCAPPVVSSSPADESRGALLGARAQECVTVALEHWLLSEGADGEHRRAAFSSLRQAFNHAGPLDVRLYMYTLSDAAAALYRAYEREVTE